MLHVSQSRYRNWTPYGFHLLNVENTQKRLKLEKGLRLLFHHAEYKEISPPAFDYAATFQLTTRHAKHNPVFHILSSTQEELALRSDLTVQVIKATANGQLAGDWRKEELRFSYIQPVFQDHPWGSGYKREMLQAGVELIGGSTKGRIQELLRLLRECTKLLELKPRILYGDVRVIEELFAEVPHAIRSELSWAFHNKDTSMIRGLCGRHKLQAGLTKILTELPLLCGDHEKMRELKLLCAPYPKVCALLREAEEIEEDMIFDFSLVRELSYYTGPVFEAYLPGHNEKVFTGGVYDRLFGEFARTEDCPASGFALNLSFLIEIAP